MTGKEGVFKLSASIRLRPEYAMKLEALSKRFRKTRGESVEYLLDHFLRGLTDDQENLLKSLEDHLLSTQQTKQLELCARLRQTFAK